MNKIDADESNLKVQKIVANYGRSMRWICETSGLDTRTVTALKAGRRVRILKTTASAVDYAYLQAMSNAPVDPKMKSGYADSGLAVRAIRSLMSQGYTQGWIAHKVGLDVRTVSTVARGKQKYVKNETSDSLVYLVRHIGSTEGTSRIAASYAAKRGWRPSIWDDSFV